MIQFQVLGSIDLRDESGRELRPVLAQPKRLALLAYLAAASPAGPHRRDTLLGMFWPELDQDHARNALSKAVHFLRRSLSEGAIVSRTADELALEETKVWTDVRAFDVALEGQRIEEALELYRGDLLPSFFVPDAPGFEEWVERERARLRSQAAAASRILAERHEAGRHLTLAVVSARRAVELSNGDERPLRRLIELLDRLGDRAGAVRAYEEFARRLATELEVEPAPETMALIRRIRATPSQQARSSAEPPAIPASEPPIARLATAVAHRYKMERQLGAGAMALVALAHDLRHHRRVAIKILRPELSSLMGAERFLREIDIAASLVHPHILPLHDSGEAGGLLYYVMPYVEGESLRGRLERQRRLPLPDALQIAREVADALAYAHHRGFVHRDIKPENILLSGGHALVADFGIARALGTLEDERPSPRGLGTGTPAYMSPEQASGDGPVDERTDIYALGCVLYEMLGGEPPFTGNTPQEAIAQRLSAPARPVSRLREEVSEELDAALLKALARVPGQRFSKIAEFGAALQGSLPETSGVESWKRKYRKVAGVLAAVVLVLGGLLAVSRGRSPAGAGATADAIAVLPFRVTGSDSLLTSLGEGMIDLLTTSMSAGAGVRTVDPRTTMAAWHRTSRGSNQDVPLNTALAIANDLGVRRAITGSIVGAFGKVTLTASLFSVPDGTMRSRSSITGEQDSLLVMVDALTAQLLSRAAGEAEYRLAALTSTSLPALRAYLDGQAASRRFAFDRAREHFRRAVQLDSTFALAALGLYTSLYWGHTRFTPEMIERTANLAWTYRNRLSPHDQLRLRARLGAHYPEWTPPGEQMAFLDSAVTIVPDDPELWQIFGFHLFHGGAHLAVPDWRERSSAALRRAIELDSLFLAPRNHLVRLSVEAGDTAGIRGLSAFYLQHAPPEAAEMILWLASYAAGDSVAARAGTPGLRTFTEQSLRRVVIEGQSFGIGLHDADTALQLLLERSASGAERQRTLMLAREYSMNRGQVAINLRVMKELVGASMATSFGQERLRELVYYSLYWKGDETAGKWAVELLTRAAQGPLATDSTRLTDQLHALCVLEQWRIAHNDRRTARQTIVRLNAALPRLSRRETARTLACAGLIEAMLSSAERRPDLFQVLSRLDSLHMAALPDLRNEDIWFCAGNLVAARLRAAHGDYTGALAAIRRRGEPGDQKILLSAFLREEGKLAALTGDTAGAARAYHHYLALRSKPEPPGAMQRDSVRTELARLEEQTS